MSPDGLAALAAGNSRRRVCDRDTPRPMRGSWVYHRAETEGGRPVVVDHITSGPFRSASSAPPVSSTSPYKNRATAAIRRLPSPGSVGYTEEVGTVLDQQIRRRKRLPNLGRRPLLAVMIAVLAVLSGLIFGGRGILWVLVLGATTLAVRPRVPSEWVLSMYGT